MMRGRRLPAQALALLWLACVPAIGSAQVTTNPPPAVAGAKPVTIEHITVHAPTIEGNLEGNSADRTVLVVLPPGYARSPRHRYTVLYALHGYSIGAEQWSKEIYLQAGSAGAFAKGAHEMIIVLPDAKTVHNGSFYGSSVTTGDFETFVSRDLIGYIDAHYRTIPDRQSRGLVGHSMGGYGTARIGMRHPDMFGAIYMMSPCCLSARTADQIDPQTAAAMEAVKTPAESATLPFLVRAQLATAAAWSPDPKAPPLYLDLPTKAGRPQPDILAKWAANAPLAFVDQYVGNLRRYKAIAIDVGDQDGLRVDAGKLHQALDGYGIANRFTIYPGTHTSNVATRFQEDVLPFFSASLRFER